MFSLSRLLYELILVFLFNRSTPSGWDPKARGVHGQDPARVRILSDQSHAHLQHLTLPRFRVLVVIFIIPLACVNYTRSTKRSTNLYAVRGRRPLWPATILHSFLCSIEALAAEILHRFKILWSKFFCLLWPTTCLF